MRRFPAVCALALLPACALLPRRGAESPEEAAARTAGEARIAAEVRARLALEPSVDEARVRVEVARTDVHLHGSVRGFGALRCALSTAALVPGVTLVVDYLVLEPGPTETRCLAPRVLPGASG